MTASGDYLLRPIEEYAPTGVQALRIQRTSSTYLTLEFRQPSGTFDDFPATSLMATGVIVHITPGTRPARSRSSSTRIPDRRATPTRRSPSARRSPIR